MNDKTDTNAEAQATQDEPMLAETTSGEAAAVGTEATTGNAEFTPADLTVPLAPAAAGPETGRAEAVPEAVAVPNPQSQPQPQPITVQVDAETKALLSQQFVTLSGAVLDAADVASKAARAANDAGEKFNASSARLTKLSQGMGMKSTIVLASTATLMVVSIGFFAVMGVRMSSKVNQLDATMMSVGKRAVELTASLESLSLIGEKMGELTAQQEMLTKSQTELEQRIASTLAASTESVQKVPDALAKQMTASTRGVTKQVEGLGAQLKTQAGAVQALSKDVKALQSTVGDVNLLKRDVQALVTLQRERYLEQLQKQTAAAQEAKRPSPVQYPRPSTTSAAPTAKPAQ